MNGQIRLTVDTGEDRVTVQQRIAGMSATQIIWHFFSRVLGYCIFIMIADEGKSCSNKAMGILL